MSEGADAGATFTADEAGGAGATLSATAIITALFGSALSFTGSVGLAEAIPGAVETVGTGAAGIALTVKSALFAATALAAVLWTGVGSFAVFAGPIATDGLIATTAVTGARLGRLTSFAVAVATDRVIATATVLGTSLRVLTYFAGAIATDGTSATGTGLRIRA